MLNFRKSLGLIALVLFANMAFAQFNLGGGFGKPDTSNKALKLAAFPYVNYDRTQELMYGAVGMGMFRFNREDTLSPKSMAGIMAIGTTTQTWGVLGFGSLHWKQDQWRAMIVGGYFSFNFQTYWKPLPNFNGTYLRYNTGYTLLYGKILRNVFKPEKKSKLYVGTHAMYANANTTFYVKERPLEAEPTHLNNTGIDAEFDSRNDVYFPSKGVYIESNWMWYADWLQNEQAFNKINLSINQYIRLNKRVIQASRFHTAFGVGDVPFEGQEIIGQRDIRGYSLGKQRGAQLFSLQTETRIHIWKRFSAVAFAGVATAANQPEDYNWDNLWPGAGAGLRVLVMEKEHLNIGLDVATGKHDWSMSFTIGESF